MEDIFFGGAAPSSGAVKAAPFNKKEQSISSKLFTDALIQAVEGSPPDDNYKGTTLEKGWQMAGMVTGKYPVCLLATGQPEVPVAKIERVVRAHPAQLVDTLKALYAIGPKLMAMTNFYDGHTGHTICLAGYDAPRKRFLYYDPWPDFSLLVKEYNHAGVDAQKETGPNFKGWSITDEELQRVVFSVFVPCNYWAAWECKKITRQFAALQETDFWQFFNIAVTGAEDIYSGKIYFLKTGGFQQEIDLSVTVNTAGDIIESNLLISRSWLIGPPYGTNPFAMDIVRSFINVMLSPADQQQVQPLLGVFDFGRAQEYLTSIIAKKDNNPLYTKMFMVYTGVEEVHFVPFVYSSLLFKNEQHESGKRMLIRTTVDSIEK